MRHNTDQHRAPRLLWVHAAPLLSALDGATWIETTRHLRNMGWDVVLLGEGPRGAHVVDGVEIQCRPKSGKYVIGTALFHLSVLSMTIRHFSEIDILLFHQMSAIWLFPLKLLRMVMGQAYPKFVMDTRDLPTTEKGFKKHLRSAYFTFVHWLANHVADGQTAITHRMVELVDIPADNLWGIWPSGVEVERFSSAQDGRIWPQDDQPIRLCYVGKLHMERNLLPLCEAVKNANTNQQYFQLDLVGKGPHEDVFRRLAAEPETGIAVLDPVPHDQVPNILREAHIGVTSLPEPGDKKFQASSPIKLFEYMAAGLPILSTSNPCHTDVVGNGQYAFWADAATSSAVQNALAQAQANEYRLSQLGEEAFAEADNWSWRASAAKLSEALATGLNKSIARSVIPMTSPDSTE